MGISYAPVFIGKSRFLQPRREALKRCRETCFGRHSGFLAAGSRRCWSSPRGN
ncbi:unnamed protein product [Musa hybrid cultivar]